MMGSYEHVITPFTKQILFSSIRNRMYNSKKPGGYQVDIPPVPFWQKVSYVLELVHNTLKVDNIDHTVVIHISR